MVGIQWNGLLMVHLQKARALRKVANINDMSGRDSPAACARAGPSIKPFNRQFFSSNKRSMPLYAAFPLLLEVKKDRQTKQD